MGWLPNSTALIDEATRVGRSVGFASALVSPIAVLTVHQVLTMESCQGREQLPQQQQHLTSSKDKLMFLACLQQVLVGAPVDPFAHLPATTIGR